MNSRINLKRQFKLMINKIIDTKLASLNYDSYPLIYLKTKKLTTKLSVDDVDKFLDQLKYIFETTKGPFILFSDIEYYSWSSYEVRERFGLGIQHLAKTYKKRYRLNYIYMSNIIVYFLIKTVLGFLKPEVSIIASFNKKKLHEKALKYIQNI